jgi:hypothetical protein
MNVSHNKLFYTHFLAQHKTGKLNEMREVLGFTENSRGSIMAHVLLVCVYSPVNILPGQGGISRPRDVVDPVVGAESDRVADGKVNAGIPVNDEQDEEHHLRTAKRPQGFFYCAETSDGSVGFRVAAASCGRPTAMSARKVMQNDMKETGPLL